MRRIAVLPDAAFDVDTFVSAHAESGVRSRTVIRCAERNGASFVIWTEATPAEVADAIRAVVALPENE